MKSVKTTDEIIVEKRVAREILSTIEDICFSERYAKYRVNYGSNGRRDLIIKIIKEKYEIS